MAHTSLRSRIKTLLGEENHKKASETYRNLTSSLRMLPNYIIIGAQKAGTSSLHRYLNYHPKIYPGLKKETQFFSVSYSKGVAWYRSHFPLFTKAKKGLITGEASPYYLYHPHSANRIAETLPDVKLIVLLRNPVERALSHYWYLVSRGDEYLPIHEAINRENERLAGEKDKMISNEHYYSEAHQAYSYLDRGKYADQLRTYFRYFDRDKLLIIKSENLFNDTDKIYSKVLDFLEVNSYSLPKFKAYNTTTDKKNVERGVKKELRDFFQPYNEDLYELLDRDFKW